MAVFQHGIGATGAMNQPALGVNARGPLKEQALLRQVGAGLNRFSQQLEALRDAASRKPVQQRVNSGSG